MSAADRLRLCPQVTIVIKYFFQFGFFPFNQKLEVDRSKPFHPPNILGVEKKEGYVLYDLLQLLALFYHRAILKVRPPPPAGAPCWRPRPQPLLTAPLPHSATGCGTRPSPWRRTPAPTTRRTPAVSSSLLIHRTSRCGAGAGNGPSPAAASSRPWQVGSDRNPPQNQQPRRPGWLHSRVV